MTNPTLTEQPWPSDEQIDRAHKLGDEYPREWSTFDLSGCRHTCSSYVELGSWAVEVCEACGHATVRCMHTECEWNEAGSLLRCKTCGVDAT